MGTNVNLSVSLDEGTTLSQTKKFYDAMLSKSYKEITPSRRKYQMTFNDNLTDKEIISMIKKEFSNITYSLGIKKFSVVAHFEKNNVVIFFCQRNPLNSMSKLAV
ncbi:MAG: hypothetical protein WCJ01_06765 [Ignavibacteria bacterium]